MKSPHLIEQELDITGKVTFTNFLIDSDRASEIQSELSCEVTPERYTELVDELGRLCKTKTVTKTNIVTLSGRAVMARLLIGDDTYTGAVNYGALGDDNTAVNSADTTLGNEVARKSYALRTRTNAQVNINFFYSQSDTDGTYEEFGTFIDGTSATDSGQMFNHVLTGGWTKTALEAMVVSVQFDVNQA